MVRVGSVLRALFVGFEGPVPAALLVAAPAVGLVAGTLAALAGVAAAGRRTGPLVTGGWFPGPAGTSLAPGTWAPAVGRLASGPLTPGGSACGGFAGSAFRAPE